MGWWGGAVSHHLGGKGGAVGRGSHFGCGGGHFLLGAAILGSGGRHIAERKLPSWGVGAAILEGQVAIFWGGVSRHLAVRPSDPTPTALPDL